MTIHQETPVQLGHDEYLELNSLPPVLERYELKYLIPSCYIEPISNFVGAYCKLDSHSAEYADGFYPVNSLYFDSPNYRFLRLRMQGSDRRFNMRVRSYGDGKCGPFFAEIKFKTPTCVKKFRATLDQTEWPTFLPHNYWLEPDLQRLVQPITPQSEKEGLSRELFLRLADAYAIEPKIFTRYHRRAFASTMDDYARVTMDVNMKFRSQNLLCSRNPYSLQPDTDCVNYDASTIYGDDPGHDAAVVLELKTAVGSIPVWMLELIRRFQLKQVGFSKYMHSSLAEHWDGGDHYMDDARYATA